MTFVAFNATFFPMHIIGVQGQPRRVYTYEDQFGNWNFFISIAFVLGASFIVFLYNMVVSWAAAAGAGKPVAGQHARVAGVLAAAHLQLRRDSPGGREPVRVRRARREARDPERRSRDGDRDGDRGGAAVRHLLVVANETVTGGGLIDAVKRKAKEQDVELVTVLAPVSTPEAGYVVYEDTRRAAAGRRLDRTLVAAARSRHPAHGLVLETDPEAAVKDAFGMLDPPPTEIIVSTHPIQKSGWLRKNVVDRIKKAAATSSSSTSSSTTRTKRDAQRARRRQRDRRRQGADRSDPERAERGPASFLIISPQSDPSQSAHPEAERRLRRALSERGAGIDAHGQIAHPDPYTAAMQAIEDERVDEVIVSTFEPRGRCGCAVTSSSG